MRTSIIGHGAVRNGVVQTGAVALLLAAALAASGAHAAENVELEDSVARPGEPAAPPRPAAPPAPPAPVAPPEINERAVTSAERRAQERRAEERRAAEEGRAERNPTAAERRAEQNRLAEERRHAREEARRHSGSDRDERMRDAQDRLEKAASEVASIAAERAAEAMEAMPWLEERNRRTVIGVQLSAEGGQGAKVVDVSPGGPAELAGVRAGDVIVGVNGKEVKGGSDSARAVTRLLRDVEPNSKVNLRVLRNGQPKTFEFAARPFGPGTFVYKGGPPPGSIGDAFSGSFGPFNFQFSTRSELAGLEVTALTPQLGRYFGTDKGMLVVRAPKGDVFKLQDGDVIVSIDGREPTSGSHITRILSSYQPGEQLTLRVMRDRKTQDIVVTLPEDQRQGFTRTTWLDAEA